MSVRDQKPIAIILGLSINGLSVVRSLGRKGIRVVAVDINKPSAVSHSRYLARFECFECGNPEEDILRFLLTFGKEQSGRSFLFPTNDFFVLFVSRNRMALGEYFNFTMASEEIMESLPNKKLQYSQAEELEIPYPKTLFVDFAEVDSNTLDQCVFPCYIKPVYSHLWRQRYRNEKVLYVTNRQQLMHYLSEIRALDLEVMIQEIIPGGDETLFGVMAFLDHESQPIAVCAKRKLRQFPIGIGDGSLQVTIENKPLEEMAVRFLQQIRYAGSACFEFRFDKRSREYKLIEINPRTVSGQEMMTQAGVDIPYIAYEYAMDGKRVKPEGYRTGLKWMCFAWDFRAFLQARRMGILTFGQWIQSIWGSKVFAYFCWDDPVPFIVESMGFLRDLFMSVIRRIRPGNRKHETENHTEPLVPTGTEKSAVPDFEKQVRR